SLVASGCIAYHELQLPSPTSERPVAAALPGLRAGFGRADITPPPGVGLAGNGPEGRRAAGHRVRLYARALLLEDRTGERGALCAWRGSRGVPPRCGDTRAIGATKRSCATSPSGRRPHR